MIIYIFKKLFKTIIGNIPKDKQAELWFMFNKLMAEIIKATAGENNLALNPSLEGAVKGIKEK